MSDAYPGAMSKVASISKAYSGEDRITAPPGEITGSLISLAEVITILEDEVSGLGRELNPILSSQEVSKDPRSERIVSGESSIAREISSSSSRVTDLVNVVRSLRRDLRI